MKLHDDIDFTTLSWVKQELDETLKQARQALEAYVEDTSDTSQMRFCATYLHQVQGTLRMVELYGAALVVEEMEHVALGLLDDQINDKEEAYAMLMRGIVQLPDYLERLQGGHRDIPVVLLPLLNDLRTVRGQKLLSETVLFSPQMDTPLPESAAGPDSPLDDRTLRVAAAKIRKVFEASLLHWFKAEADVAMISRLVVLCAKLRQICSEENVRRLFWVAEGVLDGIRNDALDPSSTLKVLYGKLDREIKRLALQGEAYFAENPPEELLKALLYYAAHAGPGSSRLDEIKAVFDLTDMLPNAEELEHAKGAISGHNRELLSTVSGAIKEDLMRVKDALDLKVRQNDMSTEGFEEQTETLHRVGDTLGMLGLGIPRTVVQDQKQKLEVLVQGDSDISESALLDIAGSLLIVESSLDDHIEQLGSPSRPAEDQAVADATPDLPKSEVRRILDSLMKEASGNLQLIKQNFVEFIEAPWDHEKISQTPQLLEEIVGALKMLDLDEAATLLRGIVAYTQVELIKKRTVPNAEELDTVADAVASLEYYLEAVREHRPGRDKILEVARQSLRKLGYFGDEEIATMLEAAEQAPEPAGDALAAASEQATEQQAEETRSEELLELDGIEADEAETVEIAAQELVSPEAESPTVGDQAADISDEIDDEIKEVFIEEVEEELENLKELYPRWKLDVRDEETLTTIRRTFHTLKGSGRLVGAYTIGEFAWEIENMLNRVLDASIAAGPDLIDLMDHAVDALPGLLANVKGEGRPTADIEGIKRVASQLTAGDLVRLESAAPAEALDETSEEIPEETSQESAAQTAEEAESVPHEEADDIVEASGLIGESHEADITAEIEAVFDERDLDAADLEQVAEESADDAAPDLLEDDWDITAEFLEEQSVPEEGPLLESTEEDALSLADFDEGGLELVPLEEDLAGENVDAEQVSLLGESGLAPDDVEGEARAGESIADFDLDGLELEPLDAESSDAPATPGEGIAAFQIDDPALALSDEPAGPADDEPESEKFELPETGLELEPVADLEADNDGMEWDLDVPSDTEKTEKEISAEFEPAFDAGLPDVDLSLEDHDDAADELSLEASGGLDDFIDELGVIESDGEESETPEATELEGGEAFDADLEAFVSNLDDESGGEAVPGVEEAAGVGGMDPVLREILRTEVSTHLDVVKEYLTACDEAGYPVSVGEPVLRSVHTLNGAIAMVDLPELTAVTSPLEGYVKRLLVGDQAPSDVGLSAIRDTVTTIELVLTELESTEFQLPDTEALSLQLGNLRDGLPEPEGSTRLFPVEEESGSPTEGLLESELTDQNIESDAGQAVSDIPGAGLEGDEEIQPFDLDFDMDLPEETRESAAPEAGELSYVDLSLDDGTPGEDGEASAGGPDTDAQLADLELVSDADLEGLDLSGLLDGDEDSQLESESSVSGPVSSELSLEVDELEVNESVRDQFEAEQETEDETEDEEALVASTEAGEEAAGEAIAELASDLEAWERSGEDSADTSASDDTVDISEFGDIDEELLDIFLQEGAEILDASDHKMAEWRENQDSHDPVVELQRELHTLKGGARMAGLSPIGDLSHAMESLFEGVVEERVSVSGRTIEVLEQAFDRLHQMLDKVRTRGPVPTGRSTIVQIEALIAGKPEPTEESAKPALKEKDKAGKKARKKAKEKADRVFEPESDIPAEKDKDKTKAKSDKREEQAAEETEKRPAVEPPPVPARPKAAVAPTALDEEEHHRGAVTARPQQELIRVRADLLDNLVNYAGEVSIYRSRLEQQIGTFRFNLVEFDQTVNRLREQLRKLEMETEAQILSRYQREAEELDETFDPLELDRFSTLQQLSRGLAESVSDLVSIQGLLDDLTRQSETLLLQQSRVNSDLQEGLMRTRMVPFDSLVPRLRRILRQTSKELEKKAQLRVEGAQGEMDRTVLERITAPLEHMLRNAVAHGLESPEDREKSGKNPEGSIRLGVSREATEVVVTVEDDGGGIDHERVRQKAVERGLLREDSELTDRDLFGFILETGFTTAEEVTKVAGRGVGMDVVNSEIKQLGGSLDITSKRGEGTKFTIRLPFTLAVTHAIMVRVGESTFAIPLTSIQGVVRMSLHEFDRRINEGETVYEYTGEDYQLKELSVLLGMEGRDHSEDDMVPVLMSRIGDQRAAIRVDSVMGSREIVVKSVGPQISSIPGIFGATILGDGSVIMILDLGPLIRRGAALQLTTELVGGEPEVIEAPEEKERIPLIMVVDDSITMRKVTTRVLQRHDMEVLTAKDGVDAVEQLQDRVPDLMLLDIEMPRMDGFEVATHMKNDDRLKGIPIIMITSRTGEKHRERALEIGVNRYLGKPYQEADLLSNVQELLDEAVAAG